MISVPLYQLFRIAWQIKMEKQHFGHIYCVYNMNPSIFKWWTRHSNSSLFMYSCVELFRVPSVWIHRQHIQPSCINVQLWQFFQFVYSVRLGDPIKFCFCSFSIGPFYFQSMSSGFEQAHRIDDSIPNLLTPPTSTESNNVLNWWLANEVKTIYSAMRSYFLKKKCVDLLLLCVNISSFLSLCSSVTSENRKTRCWRWRWPQTKRT